jgi:hypothetical protein
MVVATAGAKPAALYCCCCSCNPLAAALCLLNTWQYVCPVQALSAPQKVVIDLDFNGMMSPSEVKSLLQQLSYSYSAAVSGQQQLHLHLLGATGACSKQAGQMGMSALPNHGDATCVLCVLCTCCGTHCPPCMLALLNHGGPTCVLSVLYTCCGTRCPTGMLCRCVLAAVPA